MSFVKGKRGAESWRVAREIFSYFLKFLFSSEGRCELLFERRGGVVVVK